MHEVVLLGDNNRPRIRFRLPLTALYEVFGWFQTHFLGLGAGFICCWTSNTLPPVFFGSVVYNLNLKKTKLYVATLVARLPILAIASADEKLPKVNKEKSDSDKQGSFIVTHLEVKWVKVAATIEAIIGGQILEILIVLYYCRDVFIRDDSYLSTARLLNTVTAKVEHGSLGTGKQLAKYLDGSLGLQVQYGTKSIGGKLVVDLSDDVVLEQRFPQDWEYEGIPASGLV
ncbi:hypothetical protein BDD12DRAFT_890889 [Trichophaea hybrida]|nr:hypothetical protein BDD12DRAFT_890889 [Trichophaea hybrida]